MARDLYEAFLSSKMAYAQSPGLATSTMPDRLFPFQRQVTTWALSCGRAALFLDTGLGKSACQLVWAQNVVAQHGDVLILAPLAVAQQTVAEGATMGIPVTLCRTGAQMRPGINITNYERLHHFQVDHLAGVVLDESSILKSYDGKTRTQLIETFRQTPYRLCCTATPSPNDYMELGNHAEFLGIMSRNEMLATFFTHDGGNTSQWRLKRHAEQPFWRWVASWAVALTHPLLLGDTTPGYDLPPLNRSLHPLSIDVAHEGLTLFPMEATSLTEQRAAKRAGMNRRVQECVWEICRSWANHVPNTGEPTMLPTENVDLRISVVPTEDISQSVLLRKSFDEIPQARMLNGNISANTTRQISNDISSEVLPSLSSDTDLTSMHSLPSLPHKAGTAPSVNALLSQTGHSTSTTTTKQEQYEGSSATNAICDLGVAKTAQTLHVQSGMHTLLTISPMPKLEPWLIWAELNDEQDALSRAFGDLAFSVYGKDSLEEKEEAILGWLRGDRPVMISKPSIMGWGLNFQHCARMCFVGINNSFESWYQSVRRCWRFGQTRPVDVHLFYLDIEAAILRNLYRKEQEAQRMHHLMTQAIIEHQTWQAPVQPYAPTQAMQVPAWLTNNIERETYASRD